jgi:hypothetical protein
MSQHRSLIERQANLSEIEDARKAREESDKNFKTIIEVQDHIRRQAVCKSAASRRALSAALGGEFLRKSQTLRPLLLLLLFLFLCNNTKLEIPQIIGFVPPVLKTTKITSPQYERNIPTQDDGCWHMRPSSSGFTRNSLPSPLYCGLMEYQVLVSFSSCA